MMFAPSPPVPKVKKEKKISKAKALGTNRYLAHPTSYQYRTMQGRGFTLKTEVYDYIKYVYERPTIYNDVWIERIKSNGRGDLDMRVERAGGIFHDAKDDRWEESLQWYLDKAKRIF